MNQHYDPVTWNIHELLIQGTVYRDVTRRASFEVAHS